MDALSLSALPDTLLKTARILIIDDQAVNIHLLEDLLTRDGFSEIQSSTDPFQAYELFTTFDPDLLLLDLRMPLLDGFGVLEQLRPLLPPGVFRPILVLTADISAEAKQRALSSGAKDFLTKPLDLAEVRLRIHNLLEARFLYLQLRDQNQNLEEEVQARTADIAQSNADLLAAVALLQSEVDERKRAEAALAQNAAELAALYRATSSLLHPVYGLNQLAEEIAQAITQEFDLDDCGIMLVNQDQTELIRVARAGDFQVTKGPQLMLKGSGLSVAAFRNAEPVYAPDVQADSRYIPSESRTRSELAIPLQVGGQVIGVVDLQSPQPNAFDEQARRIVAAYAERAALALQTARLHEQTELQLQRLTALRAIDTAITASLDLNLTLRVFLEQVTSQLKVDAAAVLKLATGTQMLEFAAGRGFSTKIIERSRLRLGEGYAGRAGLERRLISLPDMSVGDLPFVRKDLQNAEGFRSYYALPLISKGVVKGVLEIFNRTTLPAHPEWLDFLEALAKQAAIAIDNAELFTGLQNANTKLYLAYDATIEGWSRALDLRDKETEGHTQRVTEMTLALARALDLPQEDLAQIRWGALLHDIGKMGIPDRILLKPGPLTDEEWVIMRQHPQFAFDWLSPIEYLRKALEIPYCHHEKWDGSGYPRRLKGHEIPLSARLFAIVDVWDALRSDRPYRESWPVERVREHLRAGAGTHFEPRLVEVFLKVQAGD